MLNVTVGKAYLVEMIEGRKCSDNRFKSNPILVKQLLKVLVILQSAARFEDLQRIGSLHLETLSGSLAGYWSARLNDKYRLLFTVIPSGAQPAEITGLHLEEISNHYA